MLHLGVDEGVHGSARNRVENDVGLSLDVEPDGPENGSECQKSVRKTYRDDEESWDGVIQRVLSKYRRRMLVRSCSSFELMYGVPPRIVQGDGRRETGTHKD